jgi:hypothetical protein
MDIVGYSKLVIDKQTDLTRKLNEIVRNAPQFQIAETEGILQFLRIERSLINNWQSSLVKPSVL